MAALQTLTEVSSGAGNQRRLWSIIGGRGKPRSPRKELLGVDVGSALIKAVLLSQQQDQLTLKQAVLAPTPPGVVTNGEMTDAISVAGCLRKLCKDHHLKTRQVAVAVSGEKVYAQIESLPREFEEGLDEFIQNAMMKVIPYSIDRAAFDYERLPAADASSPTVLWVSSVADQVEWAREAITLAGKVPAVVDAQACALANAYAFNHKPPPGEVAVLLHVGPRQMTLALLRGATLLCARDATLSRDHGEPEPNRAADLVVAELERRWDLLLQQAAPAQPAKLFVSGGAAQSAELRQALLECSGLPVEELNPFREISFAPDSEPGRIAVEHRSTLAVAVGLALRGLEDL
ncbi:MAG: pilus assembly protein PilM [Bryobacterales bacterium]